MGAANRRVLTGCQRPGFTWLWPLPRQTRVSSPFQPQRSRSRGRSRKPLPGVTGADADTPRRWPGAAGATTGWATVMPTASGQRSLEDPFFKQGDTHTHTLGWPQPHDCSRSSWASVPLRFYSLRLQRARGRQGAANSGRLLILTGAGQRRHPSQAWGAGVGGRKPRGAWRGCSPLPAALPASAPACGRLRAVSIYSAEHGTGAHR